MEMRREFVVVGAMTAARHRDGGAVSGKAIMETEEAISRPEAAAGAIHSGAKRNREQRCSESAMTGDASD